MELLGNVKLFNQIYEKMLQGTVLMVSKSRKIVDVLSFVRRVLASLNTNLAILSAEFSISAPYLSFVCPVSDTEDCQCKKTKISLIQPAKCSRQVSYLKDKLHNFLDTDNIP